MLQCSRSISCEQRHRSAAHGCVCSPGTNIAVMLCCDGPAILSPSPRAWPAVLGAADMPIGCALKFCPARRAAPKLECGVALSVDQRGTDGPRPSKSVQCRRLTQQGALCVTMARNEESWTKSIALAGIAPEQRRQLGRA